MFARLLAIAWKSSVGSADLAQPLGVRHHFRTFAAPESVVACFEFRRKVRRRCLTPKGSDTDGITCPVAHGSITNRAPSERSTGSKWASRSGGFVLKRLRPLADSNA